MELNYQIAALEDVDHLLPFIQKFYAWEKIPYDSTTTIKALKEFINTPDWGSVWLIMARDHPIGYIIVTFGYSLEFKGRDAFVDEFFLDEAYRNQGIGSQTLDYVTHFCKNQGIKALHLEVAKTNHLAQHTYQKLGFNKRDKYFLMTNYLGS